MSLKRSRNVMVRLTEEEFSGLSAALPDGEEIAVFARQTLLTALSSQRPSEMRGVAAFIVAALSPDIGYEEALGLFDDQIICPKGA